MSTRKPLSEQIEAAQAEIKQKENRLKELLQKHKAQERKERTHRLCERGGYLESIMPDTMPLTAEQFKAFLDKTLLTDHAKRILNGITAQDNDGIHTPKPADTEQINITAGAEQIGKTGRQIG